MSEIETYRRDDEPVEVVLTNQHNIVTGWGIFLGLLGFAILIMVVVSAAIVAGAILLVLVVPAAGWLVYDLDRMIRWRDRTVRSLRGREGARGAAR